jgi:hypothetical protein
MTLGPCTLQFRFKRDYTEFHDQSATIVTLCFGNCIANRYSHCSSRNELLWAQWGSKNILIWMYHSASCKNPKHVNVWKTKLRTLLILFLVTRNVLKKGKSKLKVGRKIERNKVRSKKSKEATKRSLNVRSMGRQRRIDFYDRDTRFHSNVSELLPDYRETSRNYILALYTKKDAHVLDKHVSLNSILKIPHVFYWCAETSDFTATKRTP